MRRCQATSDGSVGQEFSLLDIVRTRCYAPPRWFLSHIGSLVIRAPRERDGGSSMMRQGIAPVLVVEYDEGVRTVLRDLLTNVGYEVIEHATDAAALAFLAASPDGVVVVCGNEDADHHRAAAFFAQVVADKRIASRHRYLLLSTNPPLI